MSKKFRSICLIGLSVLVLLCCAFGHLLAPNDPNHVSLENRLLLPGGAYPLGTDQMGRCVLSRLLYGGRVTLGIVLGGSLLVILLGTTLGLLLGQRRRPSVWIESILNSVTAIPPIAYLIIFISAWGNGVFTMLIALIMSLLMRVIKLAKSRTELEFQKAYVLCAIAAGASKPHLLFVHIAPNIIREVVHFICLSCTDIVMAIVGFSFIGLGLGDDIIDWGMMVSEARGVFIARPQLIVYPMLFIFLCALAFNLLARELEGGDEAHA